MCTFFVKKPKQQIKKEHFLTIIENNPQGFGFVYTTGSRLVIVKSPSPNPEKMWNKFVKAQQRFPNSHFIGHGRIATGSNLNNDNTHPFLVNKSLSMVHNGILRQFPSTAQKSDTVQYIEQVLRKLPRNFCESSAIMDMIGRDITGSKFAFLTVDNKVYVVNRHACVVDTETGVLFSNSNYKPSEWLDYGGKKVSKSSITGKKSGSLYALPTTQKSFDFHVDADKCEIEKSENVFSDWEYCQECHDWTRSKDHDHMWNMCKTCVREYGLEGVKNETSGHKHYHGKDENLNYCDDCGINVSTESWEDFKLCSECIKMYEY